MRYALTLSSTQTLVPTGMSGGVVSSWPSLSNHRVIDATFVLRNVSAKNVCPQSAALLLPPRYFWQRPLLKLLHECGELGRRVQGHGRLGSWVVVPAAGLLTNDGGRCEVDGPLGRRRPCNGAHSSFSHLVGKVARGGRRPEVVGHFVGVPLLRSARHGVGAASGFFLCVRKKHLEPRTRSQQS